MLCRVGSSSQSLSPAYRGLNSLRNVLEEQIPEKQQNLLKLKKEHGSVSLGEVRESERENSKERLGMMNGLLDGMW